MLEKFLTLFERMVVAMETQAANQAAYLEFQKDNMFVYSAADPQPVETPKTEEKPKATRTKKADKPAEEPKPVEKPKATLADVKAAVSGYADGRLKGGSADPKGDARALMAHFGQGATKTDLIPEEAWQEVIDACASGWEPLPAKDEEL